MTKKLPKIKEKSSSTCLKPYWEYGWYCVSENPILVTYNLSIILVSNISLWLNDQGEKWCHILIHELISVYYRVGWSEKMVLEFKCNHFFFVIFVISSRISISKVTGKKFNFNSQRTLRSEINSTLGISYDSVDFFPTRLLSLRLDNK